MLYILTILNLNELNNTNFFNHIVMSNLNKQNTENHNKDCLTNDDVMSNLNKKILKTIQRLFYLNSFHDNAVNDDPSCDQTEEHPPLDSLEVADPATDVLK